MPLQAMGDYLLTLFFGQSIADGFAERQDFFNRQLLGSLVSPQASRCNRLIDLAFVEISFHCTNDYAAEEFSSMKEKSARKAVEKRKIWNLISSLCIECELNDG